MIDLYTFNTSNGQRAAIIPEECGLPYRVHNVDLTKGKHKAPEFLNINPAGAIPTIVDHDGPGGFRSRWRNRGRSRSTQSRRCASCASPTHAFAGREFLADELSVADFALACE